MEPFPSNAVAVEWEFHCQRTDFPGRPWDWLCRSREGSVVAKSKGCFSSLREAVADAGSHGFSYELPPEGR